jgi:N-glycosylase/DNA lyase
VIEFEFKERFDLGHTFECGQIFRFQSFKNPFVFYGIIKDRVIKIAQKSPNILVIESNNEENLKILLDNFFRTDLNYQAMQKAIAIDDLMEKIVKITDGLHLLRQDPFECAISYLLSQCSNIPRIKANLHTLASNFGKKVPYDHKIFYTFPKSDDIRHLSEKDFRDFGFGYRAKYIHQFIEKYEKFEELLTSNLSGSELNKNLQNFPGIGQKVADCIQLFAFGDLTSFPVDTWMRKFMIKYYTNGEKQSIKKLTELGQNLFGKWAGYAQELIFHYFRCYD